MADINFPSNPINGQTHTDSINGTVWTYSDAGGWSRAAMANTNDPFVFGDESVENISLGVNPTLLPGGGGEENTVVGFDTGSALTTARSNVLIGTGAGRVSDVVTDNVYIGANAAKLVKGGASNGNISIGSGAGGNAIDLQNSILIGYQARSANNANDRNSIVIGAFAIGAGDDTVVIGDNAITDTYLKGAIHLQNMNPNSFLKIGSNGESIENTTEFTPNSYNSAALPDPATTATGALIWVIDPTNASVVGGTHASNNGVNWVIAGTTEIITSI